MRALLTGNTRGRVDVFGAADGHLLLPRATSESAHAAGTLSTSSPPAHWRSEQHGARFDGPRVSVFSDPNRFAGV